MCVPPNHRHMEGIEVTTDTQWAGPRHICHQLGPLCVCVWGNAVVCLCGGFFFIRFSIWSYPAWMTAREQGRVQASRPDMWPLIRMSSDNLHGRTTRCVYTVFMCECLWECELSACLPYQYLVAINFWDESASTTGPAAHLWVLIVMDPTSKPNF